MFEQTPRTLAFVMAGGEGKRLRPLTNERGKPAVPFGSKYRIVDFVLSNLVNSGFMTIYVLVQYKSQSLIEHLRRSWNVGGQIEENFITAVPPQQRVGESWFKGTADSIYQNRNRITEFQPQIVLVFGADHIYRMDVRQMVRFHIEREAEVTISALPVPVEQAGGFGVLKVDEEGRVMGFEEKPADPKTIPGDSGRVLASMGNYVFSPDVLMEALEIDATREGEHDFGRTVIPALLSGRRLYAYDFLTNEVPGVQGYEEPGYWRDVGTIEAYWKAQMDLLGEKPLLDLDDPAWPIRTGSCPGPGTRIVSAEIEDSLLGEGVHLHRARIRRSVLGQGVRVEPGAEIVDSVVMGHTLVGAGARIERALVDRFNTILPRTVVSREGADAFAGAVVDPSGIVCLPRGGI